jgi:hypothetical protein
MARVIPKEIERQLDGLRAATAHAERLYRQGIISSDELEHARTYAVEQRFGPLMDTETYIAARQNGDFERYEALMNDSRSGTAAQREMAMRKVAAHKIAESHLQTNYQTAEDQEKFAKIFHKEMAKFIDTSELGDDPDSALIEAQVRLNLGEEVTKPKEEPSWAKPLQRLSDDDPHVRDFKLRDENTVGTKRYNAATDIWGEKRDSKGRYIPKYVLKEDADRVPARKNKTFAEDVKAAKETGSDRGDGYTVDSRYGVMTEAEGRALDAFEQGQRNDAAAATPAPAEQPVILPNPSEA